MFKFLEVFQKTEKSTVERAIISLNEKARQTQPLLKKS